MVIDAKTLQEQSKDLSIIFAEDEEELRDSLTRILKKFFKDVYSVKHGQEAIEQFKKNPTDIILTDLNMPIMSGLELIQLIHKTEIDPKIIVLTAFNDARMLEKLINLGIDNFISKPMDKQLLINALYKCSIAINDRRLVAQYEENILNENDELRRKNKIIMKKLHQLAETTNKVIDLESKIENKEEITPKTLGNDDDFYGSLLQEDVEELGELLIELDSKIVSLCTRCESINEFTGKELSILFRRFAAIIFQVQNIVH